MRVQHIFKEISHIRHSHKNFSFPWVFEKMKEAGKILHIEFIKSLKNK